MPKNTFAVLILLAVAALALYSCTIEVPPAGPTVVNVSNIQGGAAGAATPTGTPGAGAIVFIRTGFFGGRCPAGAGEVRNGQPVKVDCIGYATATPLGAGDVKLGPEVHGYECAWKTDRPDVVELLAAGDNPFNIDVRALRPGTAKVTATVKGVIGSFDVVVQ